MYADHRDPDNLEYCVSTERRIEPLSCFPLWAREARGEGRVDEQAEWGNDLENAGVDLESGYLRGFGLSDWRLYLMKRIG